MTAQIDKQVDADDLYAMLFRLPESEQTRFLIILLSNLDSVDVRYLGAVARALNDAGALATVRAQFDDVFINIEQKKPTETPAEKPFEQQSIDEFFASVG